VPRHWPISLAVEDVVLRPLRARDHRPWSDLRRRNAEWLTPWEATPPRPDGAPVSFRRMVREGNAMARQGATFPWLLVVSGEIAGQVTVSGISWGSARSGSVGYWIGQEFAGRGRMPLAVALVVDHCLTRAGLHRLEINVRPENAASLRVVEKLGMRYEGRRHRFLHIDGDWRDHLSFAVTEEEVGAGMVTRLAS
jgi:ribosomal-protein-alanine N-acetyltransferase